MIAIIITKARKTDASYIQEKLKKYMLDADNASWNKFFIAKHGEKAAGFGRIIDHDDFFEIASLGVDYYHRHKGIGTKILLFLVEEARKLDIQKPICLVTHRPEFFKQSGFEETTDLPVALECKKRTKCILPPSQIKIMKLTHKK